MQPGFESFLSKSDCLSGNDIPFRVFKHVDYLPVPESSCKIQRLQIKSDFFSKVLNPWANVAIYDFSRKIILIADATKI